LDKVTRDYHDGRIPLFVSISLMRQYEQQFAIDYPNPRTYFEPYPIELMDYRKSQFAGCSLLRVRCIQALTATILKTQLVKTTH
jgi:hypothetical protein